MRHRICIFKGVCLFGFFMSVSHSAYAVRADYTLGVQAEYTDNIALTEANTKNETTLSLLGGFLANHAAADLDANVRGLLEYANYLENTYDNEVLGSLSAVAEWRQLPGALHWAVEDYFTQTALNAQAAETPDNRVNANAFSAGPDIIMRLAPATTLETHLRRSEYYFEDIASDSGRNSILASWVRAVRPQLSLSANVGYEETKYSERGLSDYDRLDYFVSADTQHGRSEFLVDVGASSIDKNIGDDVSGFLGRLSLGRQIRTNARLDVDVSTQYTDSGTDLLAAGSAPFEMDRSGEQISGDVFFDRRIEARYTSGSSEMNWSGYLIARDEDYELLPQDRESKRIRLDFHRAIAESLYLNGYVQYGKETYKDLSQDNKDTELGLGLERRLARKITARLDYSFLNRNSNVAGADYDENRVLFLMYYGSDPQQFR